jgi:hypothetical protein
VRWAENTSFIFLRKFYLKHFSLREALTSHSRETRRSARRSSCKNALHFHLTLTETGTCRQSLKNFPVLNLTKFHSEAFQLLTWRSNWGFRTYLKKSIGKAIHMSFHINVF